MKNKIFISHSSKDIEYVKLFVENVLVLGLEISHERIFCSSMEGYGIKSGEYIPDILKDKIRNASLVLLFISKSYKASEICLNEMGAAWVTLSNETVIPILLPDVDFSQLGFLNINRVGLRISEHSHILKLIRNCKTHLNEDYDDERLYRKIEDFLRGISIINGSILPDNTKEKEVDAYDDVFYPFDTLMRTVMPAVADNGLYQISDPDVCNRVIRDLSDASFLKHLIYIYADGFSDLERIKKSASGSWLFTRDNWEIRVSEVWFYLHSTLPCQFILIKSERLDPYKIASDIGGFSYNVGVMGDGTIVHKNEKENGLACINGETFDLTKYGVESRIRNEKSHWIFLVSPYHKIGFNVDNTIDFCEKLDLEEKGVNISDIRLFYRTIVVNHPEARDKINIKN